MSLARVAIIDDDEQVCGVFEKYLIPLGFEVRSAYTAQQGLELFTEFEPQFVFLDVMLPDESGLTLLQRFMTMRYSTVVTMISGLHDLSIAKESIKSGAVDYIPKPIDMEFIKNYLMCQL